MERRSKDGELFWIREKEISMESYFIKLLPTEGYVLDLDCENRRDSLFLKSRGFKAKDIEFFQEIIM